MISRIDGKWIFGNGAGTHDLEQVPGRFNSVEDYVRVLEPLLFEECRAQLHSSWEELLEGSVKDAHHPVNIKGVERRERGKDSTLCDELVCAFVTLLEGWSHFSGYSFGFVCLLISLSILFFVECIFLNFVDFTLALLQGGMTWLCFPRIHTRSSSSKRVMLQFFPRLSQDQVSFTLRVQEFLWY